MKDLFKKEYENSIDISSDWLKDVKKAAWKDFLSQDFPIYKKDEKWKYTNPKSFYKNIDMGDDGFEENINNFTIPEMINIVIKDGKFYSIDNDDDNLEVLDIWDDKNKEILNNLKDRNIFCALNTAIFNSGVSIRIKKNKKLNKKIHLVHLAGSSLFIKNVIILEKFSSAEILETIISKKENKLTHVVTDIKLEEGSNLKHYKNDLVTKHNNALSISNVSIKKDALYENLYFTNGAKTLRNDIKIDLDEKGASCSANGMYILKDKNHNDNHCVINHNAENTNSTQLYKGILDDYSQAIFDGTIIVHPDSQEVSSNQLNRNVILSDTAKVETRPQLKIGADNVQCSHGATVGQIDKKQIFYFQSRGISKKKSIEILSRAFIEEVIYKLDEGIIRDYFFELANMSMK